MINPNEIPGAPLTSTNNINSLITDMNSNNNDDAISYSYQNLPEETKHTEHSISIAPANNDSDSDDNLQIITTDNALSPSEQIQQLHNLIENNSMLERLIDSENVLETDPLLMHLNELVQLPKKLGDADRAFWITTIINLIFSSASIIVYVDGSAEYGTRAQVSGAAVNFTQNLMFFYIAADALSELYRAGRYGQLTGNSLTGLFTSFPTAMTEWVLGGKNILKTLGTLVGTLPLNMVGVPNNIENLKGWLNEDEIARKFYINQFIERLSDHQELLLALKGQYSTFTKVTGNVLGYGLGTIMASAPVCYIALIARFLFDDVWDKIAFDITIAVITNLPTQLVALLMSGKDLGMDLAETSADVLDYIYQRIVHGHDTGLLNASRRTKLFTLLSAGINIPLSYLALYSNATSKSAYYKNMPEDLQNSYFDFCVVYGSIGFNMINSFLAVNGQIKNADIAYTPAGIERDKHIVRAFQAFLTKCAPEKLVALQEAINNDPRLTPDEKKELLPPTKSITKMERISNFFHCRKTAVKDGQGYQPQGYQTINGSRIHSSPVVNSNTSPTKSPNTADKVTHVNNLTLQRGGLS